MPGETSPYLCVLRVVTELQNFSCSSQEVTSLNIIINHVDNAARH